MKRTPAEGPEVFTPRPDTKGKTVVVPVGGKKLRVRIANEKAPRDLGPDEYAGKRMP